MNADIHLSLAMPDDREQLLQLHKNVRYENDFRFLPEYAKATVDSGFYEDLWQKRIFSIGDVPQVVKAESNGRIVGFCGFGALNDYPVEKVGELKKAMTELLQQCGQGIGEIRQLYIQKEFRERGIGARLYLAALENMKRSGYQHVLIGMFECNKSARSFYEKVGATHQFSYETEKTRNGQLFHYRVAIYLHKHIGSL